jgi:valine--pyruvate aminotransferase
LSFNGVSVEFSKFGKKFGANSGITSLMDDLGEALSGESEMIMMGGGNPAHIPEVQEAFKARLHDILHTQKDFESLIGTYDPPQGNIAFIRELRDLLNSEFGWQLSTENIALTNGSQSAFFMLFNLLGGEYENDISKQIQLPLTPEYIGYSDSGLTENFFHANKPSIESIDSETFKYHVNFDQLDIADNCGALCVSRPTNPTGNVLTDNEILKLDKLAKLNKIPLIIDGAYGTPFPNLIFSDAAPFWNDNIVLCLSLSKFGLPAARTGIVIAKQEIIKSISSMNAIMNLATGSFGSLLAMDLVKSRDIISLSQTVVRPYYEDKAKRARDFLLQKLKGLPVKLHKVEGAMFLWLWLKDCPVDNDVLYQRLKAKGVLIVSGHHFFPGLNDFEANAWQHTKECLRITYSQQDDLVQRGLEIIAKEVHLAYQNG